MKNEKKQKGRQKPLNEVRRGLSKKILTTMWDRAGQSQQQDAQNALTFEDLDIALNPIGTRSGQCILYQLISRHVRRQNVLKVVVKKDRKRRGRYGYILSQARLDYMYRNKIV